MIHDYSNYSVSVDGKTVTNIKTGKEVVQRRIPNGYMEVTIKCDSNSKYIKQRVHRLVVSQYKNIPLSELQAVNHKDGVRTNNDLSNLEACTRSQNASLPKHSSKKRDLPKGIHHWNIGNKKYRVSLKHLNRYYTAYFFTLDEALAHYEIQFQRLHGAKPFERNVYSVNQVAV